MFLEGGCGTMQLFKGLQLGMTLTSPSVASIKVGRDDTNRDKTARKR